jgi:DnaJ-class molecular chaperone
MLNELRDILRFLIEETFDAYKVLELDRDASPKEIKIAYRNLSKKHHPDKGGDMNRMKEINRAYALLSDP